MTQTPTTDPSAHDSNKQNGDKHNWDEHDRDEDALANFGKQGRINGKITHEII